jgi:hypothetical protein
MTTTTTIKMRYDNKISAVVVSICTVEVSFDVLSNKELIAC